MILFLYTKFIGQGLVREAGRYIMFCEQKTHGTRGGGYALAQQHGLPLTKMDLGITLKLLYATFLKGGPAVYLLAG